MNTPKETWRELFDKDFENLKKLKHLDIKYWNVSKEHTHTLFDSVADFISQTLSSELQGIVEELEKGKLLYPAPKGQRLLSREQMQCYNLGFSDAQEIIRRRMGEK